MQPWRQPLLELLKARTFSFGRFTLASGKESSYYINSKKVLFHSQSVALLGEALWGPTKRPEHPGGRRSGGRAHPDGRRRGAEPITSTAGPPWRASSSASRPKDHGSKERIEGVLPAGARGDRGR